eukprot:s3451_g5.t1
MNGSMFVWASGRTVCLPFLTFLFAGSKGASGACLPDAIAEFDRKDLVNAGESYAIGLWRTANYPAAHLTTRVAQIVLEEMQRQDMWNMLLHCILILNRQDKRAPAEMLGYNVDLKGPGGVAMDAFFALMGCIRPLNSTDRGCGQSTTYVHINLEAWPEGYAEEWARIQAKYASMAPKNLGNIGYDGTSAQFIPLAVQQKAYELESLNLDFYREYNMSRQASPHTYFTAPGDLDTSKLFPCEVTVLMSNEVMKNYFNLTGDSAGVVVDSLGLMVGRCFDGYFWYAPACRGEPRTCLIWLTAGTGWGMAEMLLKAAVYNIPLASAVANSFANYASLPVDQNFMLYWWVPDATFLRPAKILVELKHAFKCWFSSLFWDVLGLQFPQLHSTC